MAFLAFARMIRRTATKTTTAPTSTQTSLAWIPLQMVDTRSSKRDDVGSSKLHQALVHCCPDEAMYPFPALELEPCLTTFSSATLRKIVRRPSRLAMCWSWPESPVGLLPAT